MCIDKCHLEISGQHVFGQVEQERAVRFSGRKHVQNV